MLPVRGNFTLTYETSIPRQAGLSGSSAIVCAALNCLLDFYDVADQCVGPSALLSCLPFAPAVILSPTRITQ